MANKNLVYVGQYDGKQGYAGMISANSVKFKQACYHLEIFDSALKRKTGNLYSAKLTKAQREKALGLPYVIYCKNGKSEGCYEYIKNCLLIN